MHGQPPAPSALGESSFPSDDGPRHILRNRLGWVLMLVGAASILALQHFRPWEGGLLEEWGIGLAWDQAGWGAYLTSLNSTLGRPLHLLPTYLGFAVGGGTLAGPFALLAVAALVQFGAVIWAFTGTRVPRFVVVTLAFAVASHPLWAAGDILRFLPAQTAAALFWVAIACWIRSRADGRLRLPLIAAVVTVLALLCYQALALTGVLAATAIWLVHGRGVRRLVATVGGATLAAAVVAIWSIVIAPRLASDTYESNLTPGSVDLIDSIARIANTLGTQSLPILIVGIVVIVAAVVAGRCSELSAREEVAVVGLVLLSPFTAMTYASTGLHLNDPERVTLPVSVTIMVALVIFVASFEWHRVRSGVRAAVATAVAAACIVGVALGVAQWSAYAATQRWALELVGDAVADADGTDVVLVRDASGELGDIYTMLPPMLYLASLWTTGDPTVVELCTVGVQDHPIADRYPIPTTETCSVMDARFTSGVLVDRGMLDGDRVEVRIVQPVE